MEPTSSPVSPRWTPGLTLLAIGVAALAFLLGSFRAANSDVWMALATGRLLASGEFPFGVDPFSWASTGSWVNSSWLTSLAFFGLFQTIGPSGLVIAKALVCVAIAALLIAARSGDAPILPSLELTALALLVASPRFQLHSTIVSLLGLAILMGLLIRGGWWSRPALDPDPLPRSIWWTPVVFLIWSNLDGHFILGLFALALTAIGAAITADTRRQAARLGMVLAASIAACVLNPHGPANLSLPADLAVVFDGWLPASWTRAGETIVHMNRDDPGFYPVVSPFSPLAVSNASFAANIAGMAFYLLALVNVGSFIARGFVPSSRQMLSRGLVCLGFGALAAMQIRFVPFYAIVAAPISALNFADYARLGDPVPGRGRRIAFAATSLFLVVALFLAWPGWLHLGFAHFDRDNLFQSSRRVDWTLAPDESLKNAVLVLDRSARPGETLNLYNFHPDIAHYAAFFAPRVKSGIDSRFALFAETAAAYARLRDDLWNDARAALDPEQRERRDQFDWAKTFRDWNIDALAISSYHRAAHSKMAPLPYWLFQNPTTWKPIVADGQTLVFAYSPDRAWPSDALLAGWNRAAFGVSPESDWLPETALEPPVEPSWLELYAFGRGAVPLATSRAVFEIGSYQKYATLWVEPYFAAFQWSQILPAAGLAGATPGHVLGLQAGHVMALGELLFRRPVGNEAHWFHSRDLAPPALPILAQRNLRRSLDENRRIALTQSLAAQNLKRMLQEEAWWTRQQSPSLRQMLRQVAIATFLRNAVVLAPDNVDAQIQLAEFLLSNNYRDAGLVHLGEAIRALERIAVADPVQQKALDARRADWQKRHKLIATDLQKRRDDFELQSAGKSGLEKFRVAVRTPYRIVGADNKTFDDPRGRGLVLEALKILEAIDPATLKTPDERAERAFYLIEIYSLLGRIDDAVAVYTASRDDLGRLGLECLAWISAGAGWYKNLDDALAQRETELIEASRRQVPDVATVVALGFALPTPLPLPPAAQIRMAAWVQRLMLIQAEPVFRVAAATADNRTLRGLYILERGDVDRAVAMFEAALELNVDSPDRPIAVRYRDLIRRQLEK